MVFVADGVVHLATFVLFEFGEGLGIDVDGLLVVARRGVVVTVLDAYLEVVGMLGERQVDGFA